jgi:hypothetical protein
MHPSRRLLLAGRGPQLPLRLAAHLVDAVERPLEGARGLVLETEEEEGVGIGCG